MSLHRELLVAIFALVLLNLGLAFGAIGLLVRMGPAIERILEENVTTIVAAESILLELATIEASGPLDPGQSKRILEALQDAERSLTEPEERPIVETLRRRFPEVARGDPTARRLLAEDVRELILVNRNAMKRVDENAQRLGRAGAWSAVLIGFVTFLLSIFVLGRLQRRIVLPLLELHRVLQDVRAGNRQRRCHAFVDAPREVVQVTRVINELLDERLSLQRGVTVARPR